MEVEGERTAAAIDGLAAALIPDNAEGAQTDLVMAAVFPEEMLAKPAARLIRASAQRAKNFPTEVVELPLREVVELAGKAGPLMMKARKVLKQVEQGRRIFEKISTAMPR